MGSKLDAGFFGRDVLEAAPGLVGKVIFRRLPDGTVLSEKITETEAYRGEEDLACYASKGRTPKNELLYGECGIIFMRMLYGMHWMMNIITGTKGQPQGILIRAGEIHKGPAKLTKHLCIDGSFNGKIISGDDLWIEDCGFSPEIEKAPRVGVDYAGEYWKNIEWRFIAKE